MKVPYAQVCMENRNNCEHAANVSLMGLEPRKDFPVVLKTGKMPDGEVLHPVWCGCYDPKCQHAVYRHVGVLMAEYGLGGLA